MAKKTLILLLLALALPGAAALAEEVRVETVRFGMYEQDGDPGNGPEPIEWIVIQERDGAATLLARYCLDAMPFGDAWYAGWDESGLRAWLNGPFCEAAFSAAERQAIVTTEVCDNGETLGGDVPDTRDRVFLLSAEEAEALPGGDACRRAQPTAGAVVAGAWTRADGPFAGNGFYWLRTPAFADGMIAGVDDDGAVDSEDGFGYASRHVGVRPVIVARLDAAEYPRTITTLRAAAGTADDGSAVGQVVRFGWYEQGGVAGISDRWTTYEPEGGAPIEWIVLAEVDDALLLLARYCLDARPFHDGAEAQWETCSLRAWLNRAFLAAAFSPAEQALLVPRTLEDPANPYTGAPGGGPTTDRVFLLSLDEAMELLPRDGDRHTWATRYAANRHAAMSDVTDWCAWWLRTSGDGPSSAAIISYSGDLRPEGEAWGGEAALLPGVRPAICVRATVEELEALAGEAR